MAILYFNESMVRNKPDILDQLERKVGFFERNELGFGIFTIRFDLKGFELNEPIMMRFYNGVKMRSEQFGFIRELNVYR